jgi:hypothetical protein
MTSNELWLFLKKNSITQQRVLKYLESKGVDLSASTLSKQLAEPEAEIPSKYAKHYKAMMQEIDEIIFTVEVDGKTKEVNEKQFDTLFMQLQQGKLKQLRIIKSRKSV